MTCREAEPADEPFLWLMLTHAASMSPPGEAAIARAMADPDLRGYVDGWGRTGDLGVIAVDDGGAALGAAWLRLGVDDPALKQADAEVPELAIASLPSARGRGVGAAMLHALIELARGRYPAIALSVRDENPAIRLYERLGFRTERTVINRVGGASRVMRLALRAG